MRFHRNELRYRHALHALNPEHSVARRAADVAAYSDNQAEERLRPNGSRYDLFGDPSAYDLQ